MELSDKFVCECLERSTYFKHIAAPIFRKSFEISEEAAKAEISICGIGFYDLFINGTKITKGYLAPYISNPDHIVYYDIYDITSYLKPGENVIGIMLGDGFGNSKASIWNFENNVFNSSPKLAVAVKIECGEKITVYNGDDFVCKKGPVTFNDLRSGVFYDSRLEEKGWNNTGFTEDDTWHKPIKADKPRGKAKICEAEPIAVTREIKPISITKGELAKYSPREDVCRRIDGEFIPESSPARTGGYIYDFGENNSGIFRLKIKGAKGQRIDLQCAERLTDGKVDYANVNFYPDGYAQRDIYILSGEDEEVFEPMFTYHGYRYIYVSGITEEQATENLLTYLVMSSDLEKRGDFECSDDLANRIYQAGSRSNTANFYYFPTDCPHREKNGWTGDANVSAEHMIMTMSPEKSWREWLNNIRAAQAEDGRLPGIIPTDKWGYTWGNGPLWDSVIFTLPYYAYKYRGETEIIFENSSMMVRYLDYVSRKRDKRGIVEFGLGDWCQTNAENEGKYTTPLGFTDSVTVIDMCRKAEEMFAVAGFEIQHSMAKLLGDELTQAVRKEYIDFGRMSVKGNTQTGQSAGIFYNIFTEGEKQAAFNRLLEIIEIDGGKMNVGILGARTMFHVLAQFGKAELAYEMIERTDCPSYGEWVSKGKTTLPEQFLEYTGTYPISENHHFFGDVLQWYMRYPGGINVIDSNTVKIKPIFIERLDYVKTEHKLPSGKVSVFWKRDGEKIILNVQCPNDIDCEILLETPWVFEEDSRAYRTDIKSEMVIIKGNK